MRKDEPKGKVDCVHHRGNTCNAMKQLYCAKEDEICKSYDTQQTWDKKQELSRRLNEKHANGLSSKT